MQSWDCWINKKCILASYFKNRKADHLGVYVCVYVCACAYQRQRERKRDWWGQYEGESVDMGKEFGPQGAAYLRGCGKSINDRSEAILLYLVR